METILVINLENKMEKSEIMEIIAENLLKHGRVNSKQEILSSFKKREEEGDILIAEKVVLPHCESSSVIFSSIVIVKSRHPLRWNDSTVDLVIAFVVNRKDLIGIKKIITFIKYISEMSNLSQIRDLDEIELNRLLNNLTQIQGSKRKKLLIQND